MSRRHIATGVMVFCALTLTACGAEDASTNAPTESSSSATPTPASTPGDGTFVDPSTVDRADVDATAEATAMLLHSWDTTTDKTQTAAALRAKPLMSKKWADSQVEPERNGAQGQWLAPSQHQAYSVPSVVPAVGDTTRNIGSDKAIRTYNMQWQWKARDGYELKDSQKQVVTIYLEKHHGKWEVVGHNFN